MSEINRRDLLTASLAASGLALAGRATAQGAPVETAPVAPVPPMATVGQSAELASRQWTARWISAPSADASEFGVYHFRRVLELPSKPATFIVHVSGDNRYQLFVNGKRVVGGPARGDLSRWRYESVDLAPYLNAGKNVLASVIWCFAAQAPEAQVTFRPAFLLQGDGQSEESANTGTTWRVFRNESYSPLRAALSGYFVVGPGEKVEAARYPWGWQELDFDDSAWQTAGPAGNAAGLNQTSGSGGGGVGWKLMPRTIPLPEERPERLHTVRRSEGPALPPSFPASVAAVTIPANTKARYLLDQTYLTTAYPELTVSGGRGASIQLRYNEALVGQGNVKGNRNEIEGKTLAGLTDQFVLDGGARRMFRPLWWRTWRYMELVVETVAEPVTIEDLSATSTGYPFERKARFEAPEDPTLTRIQEVGWRTARLCAHETYMDCPYWEQLQYVGDARIQALVSLFNAGDARLMRNLIEQVSDSRNLSGLTMSRYPTRGAQYIPSFSLWWIGIVHDYSRYAADPGFVHQTMPAVRHVLSYFDSLERPDGLLGPVPYWRYMDWVDSWQRGAPAQEADGVSSCFDFLRIMALNWAADLEEVHGIRQMAPYYRERAKAIGTAAQSQYWDAGRRLYADTPKKANFSQHANVLAVLAGVAPAAIAADLVVRVLKDKTLAPCSIYFSHYLFTALNQVGEGDRYVPELSHWREMIDQYGLTTFPENFDTPTRSPRSDCHAWSASPNYELLHTVLGVDSAAPGFSRVLVRPFLGELTRASGSVPHPKGSVDVKLERAGARLTATIGLPAGITGEFVWKGRRRPLQAGNNSFII
jgi:alpha-L-rhamnosidase